MSDVQTWKVLQWGFIDGGVLGALIACVECGDEGGLCCMCDGTGELFQPYQLPNGAPLDLDRWAELLIQIDPPKDEEPDE